MKCYVQISYTQDRCARSRGRLALAEIFAGPQDLLLELKCTPMGGFHFAASISASAFK